jgi:hypothetical protein
MALKKLVGLAALGGFLYAHNKRGGQMNMNSFRDTARSLFSDAKAKAKDLRFQAEQKLQEKGMAGTSDYSSASQSSGIADDVTGYGSSGYSYGSDINRR